VSASVKEVEEHYEKYPYPAYPWFAMASWSQLDQVDLAAWGVKPKSPELWLAGCGSIAPLMFARRNPRAKILATDLSNKNLNQAKLRCWLFGQHQVKFEKQNLLEAHYESQFDAIDAFGVIHHTPEPAAALAIFEKALKPNGVLRLMLYSKKSREEIEALRLQFLAKNYSIDEARENIPKHLMKKFYDLRSQEGVADALLHPLVHVYDDESLNALVTTCPNLVPQRVSSSGNYVLFLRKIDSR
jgi:SAM-dependent methyltransferase